MNVYDIHTVFTAGQTHCVVAKTIGDAERIFLEHYPYTTIDSIKLHSEYVEIQDVQNE